MVPAYQRGNSRKSTRIRPLLAKDSITALQQSRTDLGPGVRRSSVEDNFVIGVGGSEDASYESASKGLESGKTSGGSCAAKSALVRRYTSRKEANAPYCKAVDSCTLIGPGLSAYLGISSLRVLGFPLPKSVQSQLKLLSVVLNELGTRTCAEMLSNGTAGRA